jgi:hypothetical protein
VEAIVGHWQVAPILTYGSGDWLNVTTGSDTALVGITGGQRVNLVGNPGIAHTPLPITVTNGKLTGGNFGVFWFNKAAFAVPTAPAGFTGNVINFGNGPVTVGPVGNLGRDGLNGPANYGFDLALTREFKINERNEIDARFEAFNIFNLVRYYDPTVAFNSPTFGQSVLPSTTTANPGYATPQDPRIMQFALKYTF